MGGGQNKFWDLSEKRKEIDKERIEEKSRKKSYLKDIFEFENKQDTTGEVMVKERDGFNVKMMRGNNKRLIFFFSLIMA